MDYKRDNAEFGSFIRKLRLARGWTLLDCANRVGISTNYVSQLERGVRDPTESLIVKFATEYKIDEGILFRKASMISPDVRNVILRNDSLQKALSYIHKNNLSQKKEREIMDRLFQDIAEFLNINVDDILNEDYLIIDD
ncbi:helix-turn-helix domain-containing protein [Cytobacillus kochii]|uniref:helix-turn-helix domain-containing protein n=1 Tax=Cytobacillus kochii TaxID=859143 RepID=UPI001CD242BE|nr:helix-turn-helix domain-containing protein [Cytobacillus kochii]MCA1025026.1 helix-turn-helix domain-containing protein [Cytobacillus kochii]